MAKIEGPTLFEIGQEIPNVDLTRPGARGRVSEGAGVIVDGLTPRPFPHQEGLLRVSPDQLASLKVPVLKTESGEIKGFQREKALPHIRKMGRVLIRGGEFPPIAVSLDYDTYEPYINDGQHRALAAIAAGQSIEVVVKRRTLDQAKELFANQSKARKLTFDGTLMVGTSALERYVQDAVKNPTHAWHPLVGTGKAGVGGGKSLTLTTMALAVGSYVHNTLNQGVNAHVERPAADFSEALADEMAGLIKAFGDRNTNPLAFRATSIRAISAAAVYIMRRGPVWPGRVDRWNKHMPSFQFGVHMHLLGASDQADKLVIHWNKKLQEVSGHRVNIVNLNRTR